MRDNLPVQFQSRVKHGIYASPAVTIEESPEEYQQLEDEYIKLFNPSDVHEEELISALVITMWRLKRSRHMEVEIFKALMERYHLDQSRAAVRAFKDKDFGTKFSQYEMRLIKTIDAITESLYTYRAHKEAGAISIPGGTK